MRAAILRGFRGSGRDNLPNLPNRVDNGRARCIGHETGKWLHRTASVHGIVQSQHIGLLRLQTRDGRLQHLHHALVFLVVPHRAEGMTMPDSMAEHTEANRDDQRKKNQCESGYLREQVRRIAVLSPASSSTAENPGLTPVRESKNSQIPY